MEQSEKYTYSIVDKFKKDIELLFEIPVSYWGIGFDIHARVGSNFSLRNTKYFENPTNKLYFHLTTYKNVFSIINSGSLRLYNILNSKDQNELNNIKIQLSNTEHLKRIKEAIFTFSCCLHDDKNIVNKKLWENYGQVALVFEFCNEAKSWDKFHFSQVFYQENVSAFNEYFDLVERNKNEYNIDFYFESVFKLGAFYKIPELSWENEVRLLYNKDWSSNSENIYNDFTVSNYHTGITKYIEIPLYIDEKIETVYLTDPELRLKSKFKNDSVPHIKIKQLIFGDNEPLMNQDKFSNVRFGIKSYVESRLGYSIDIPNQLFETGLKIN